MLIKKRGMCELIIAWYLTKTHLGDDTLSF